MSQDELPDKKTAFTNDECEQSDEPVQEESEEPTVTPSEVWEQLSPDVQARIISLLTRMAYKYALTQQKLLQDETEATGEIPGNNRQDNS